jgi:hypothetical protein
MARRWRELDARSLTAAGGIVAVAATLLLVAVDALVRDAHTTRGDDLVYERMAEQPLAPHTFPFAYRVGVPWVVHVLPFEHTLSFSALAWLCSGAAAGVLYALLRRVGVRPWIGAALALGFVASPPLLLVSLRQGRNPDAAGALAMMLGTLFVVDRRPRALALTLLVGALARETTLFLIPFAYTMWARRPLDGAALRRLAPAVAPAVAAYAALRWAIPTVGRTSVPGYGRPLLAGRIDVLREGFEQAGVQVRRLASVFGPLWLCLPVAVLRMRLARAGLVILALCAASMTFALDWGRIAFFAAPVVYAAAGWVLERHRRAAPVALAALAALNVGYAVHMQRSGVVEGIDRAPAPAYPVR